MLNRLREAKALGSLIVLVALFVFLGAAGARADVYDVTFTNVTYSASCVGESTTCTEVVNGSAVADLSTPGAPILSSISLKLTGTYTATLDEFGSVAACGTTTTGAPYFYDSGASSSVCSIQFNPTPGSTSGTSPLLPDSPLFIPAGCGGDQPTCGATGDFPLGFFDPTSGTTTFTLANQGPSPVPEPGSCVLVLCGLVALMPLRRLRRT